MKQLLLYIFLVGAPATSFGQDTLTFLNGRILHAKVLETDSTYTTVSFTKRKKEVTKAYNNDILFSIKYSNGTTDTIYTPSGEIDHYLSVEDMSLFILGEQDAKKYYKTPLTSIIGVAVSGGLGYALHDGFWVAAVPMAYTAGVYLAPTKIKAPDSRPLSVVQTEAYQEGYLAVARTKKSFNALLSSVIGTFAGAVIGHSNN